MERIDVAKLLRDCPKGMELDCTIFEDVTLYKIDTDIESDFPIRIKTKNDYFLDLTKYGTYSNVEEAKCVIFPKGKTTWEGFQRPFKDGDIVTFDNPTENHLQIFIFKDKKENNTLSSCYLMLDGDELVLEEDMYYVTRLATEEEKAELFKAIKDNGYIWNSEKKTLEKLIESKEDIHDKVLMSGMYFDREYYADEVELYLGNYEIETRNGRTYAVFKKNQETKTLKPKFKVDDKIKLKGGDEFGIITQVADCFYTIKCKNNTHCWPIEKQDDWELINKPNFKVGDTIKKKGLDIAKPIEITGVNPKMYTFRDGSFQYVEIIDKDYVLISRKFDISSLKPYDKVLVRDTKEQVWVADLFSHLVNRPLGGYTFACVGHYPSQCIPYEGNEHLLGKTDDCDEFFNLIS